MAEAAVLNRAQKIMDGKGKCGCIKGCGINEHQESWKFRWEREGPCLEWGTRTWIWPMEQVQRKVWGNQGGGGEAKIALFRLGKAGKG